MEEIKKYVITAGADAPVIYEVLNENIYLGAISFLNETTQFEIELCESGFKSLMLILALCEFTIQEKVL